MPVMQDYRIPASFLHVLRPAEANLPGRVRVLIDLMAERFRGTPYWDPCLEMVQNQSASDQSRVIGSAG